MQFKNILLSAFCGLLCLSFTGCKSAPYTLQVMTNVSRVGITGEPLKSYSFNENFVVEEGMTFYETIEGHWSLESEEYAEIIMTIENIDENAITICIEGLKKKLPFETTIQVDSNFVVYDGYNYEHIIYFEQAN